MELVDLVFEKREDVTVLRYKGNVVGMYLDPDPVTGEVQVSATARRMGALASITARSEERAKAWLVAEFLNEQAMLGPDAQLLK